MATKRRLIEQGEFQEQTEGELKALRSSITVLSKRLSSLDYAYGAHQERLKNLERRHKPLRERLFVPWLRLGRLA